VNYGGPGAAQDPFGTPAITADEMPDVVEPHIGNLAPHLLEPRPHRRRALIARAPGLRAAARLEDAILGHGRHDPVHVMRIPGIGIGFEKGDGGGVGVGHGKLAGRTADVAIIHHKILYANELH